ncbi:MAG: ferritin family protein [Candidatus Coatesbacteria bacterium]|nr:MAG: ferritin family protein [Candidatus Coatesbacteria bacterium]
MEGGERKVKKPLKRKPVSTVKLRPEKRGPESVITLETFDEIIDFAIEEEKETYRFYKKLARMMRHKWIKDVLENLAKEELKHEKFLENYKRTAHIPRIEKVQDLKTLECIKPDIHPHEDMNYGDVLVIAIEVEESAIRAYESLADKATDPKTRGIFLALAYREMLQKSKLQVEYDEHYLTQD